MNAKNDQPKFGPGPLNLITDVPGVSVGNAELVKAHTGVSVLRCDQAFVCAHDIRGGAPATRDVDVLEPENLVGRADAIVLSGGSVFGLAAADGVTNTLSKNNVGFRLSKSSPAIPITPAASLHDLGTGGSKAWGERPPYYDLGVNALEAASKNFKIGAVGAGLGARAGTLTGGLGSASIALENEIMVGALVAANPVGSVYYPDGETFYAWPWEMGEEFGGRTPKAIRDTPAPFPKHCRLNTEHHTNSNTTLAIIATSADLTRSEAKRVAMMAHDGIARAVRPAHTIYDGDIVFTVATAETKMAAKNDGERALNVAAIGAAAADCLARAIARGVYHAALQKK